MKIFITLSIIILFGCTKSSNPIQPEFIVDSRSTYTISGTVLWEHDDVTGVNNTTINLTGTEVQSTLTDVNGNYSFTVSSIGSYTVTPSKLTGLTNGLSGADATAIQQHITLINPINDPYKRVAADANKNNSISTIDATVINQAVIGNPQALAILAPSWKFVDASYELTLPVNHFAVPIGFPQTRTVTITGDTTGINFIGIKRGDVNGSCNPGL